MIDKQDIAMSNLKCIIVDDDPLIIDLIQHFCSKVEFVEYCLGCQNAIDGLQLISNQSFDVLFLDYNMPQLDGKGMLELKQDDSKVIMITAHPDFAVDSYNYPDVIDYLLKPLSFDRFYKSLEKYQRLQSHIQNPDERQAFFVKDGNKWVQVQFNQVKFIKSESNYVVLATIENNVMTLMNLKDLEKILPDHFLRVHRSYIVNTNFIDYLTTDEVNIQGKDIPVGAKYKSILKALVSGN